MTLLRKMPKQRLETIEVDSLPGHHFGSCFCSEALSLVSWYRFVPYENKQMAHCHFPSRTLTPHPPPCILCQRDKQSLDTSQPFSEQKNHRKRSDAWQKYYRAPYVSS